MQSRSIIRVLNGPPNQADGFADGRGEADHQAAHQAPRGRLHLLVEQATEEVSYERTRDQQHRDGHEHPGLADGAIEVSLVSRRGHSIPHLDSGRNPLCGA